MTPFEIRLDLLKLATSILQARADKPDQMPDAEQVVDQADTLNQFVSNKSRPSE